MEELGSIEDALYSSIRQCPRLMSKNIFDDVMHNIDIIVMSDDTDAVYSGKCESAVRETMGIIDPDALDVVTDLTVNCAKWKTKMNSVLTEIIGDASKAIPLERWWIQLDKEFIAILVPSGDSVWSHSGMEVLPVNIKGPSYKPFEKACLVRNWHWESINWNHVSKVEFDRYVTMDDLPASFIRNR